MVYRQEDWIKVVGEDLRKFSDLNQLKLETNLDLIMNGGKRHKRRFKRLSLSSD